MRCGRPRNGGGVRAPRAAAADTGARLAAMTFALKLTHDEPRLVELALVYHLGRPGSELDPDTWRPAGRGLRDVYDALILQRGGDAVIELDAAQYQKLLSAIYGCSTELRGHHMRDGQRGTVLGFTAAAFALFPSLPEDAEVALEIAEAMVMLHRRMERAVRSAAEHDRGAGTQVARRRWPFGRRDSGPKNST